MLCFAFRQSPVLHQLEAFVGIPWNPDSFYRLKMKSCSSPREKWLEGKNWFGWAVLPHVLFGPRALQGLIKPPHLGAGLRCPAQSSPRSHNQGKKPKLGELLKPEYDYFHWNLTWSLQLNTFCAVLGVPGLAQPPDFTLHQALHCDQKLKSTIFHFSLARNPSQRRSKFSQYCKFPPKRQKKWPNTIPSLPAAAFDCLVKC